MTQSNARQTVLSFIKALNEEDFETGREYVNDDLSFIGVLGARNGADTYFNDMQRLKIKYQVEKVFAEGEDVCLLYDLLIDGTTTFGCGWYHLENGKISAIRVVFDPRAVLAGAAKQQG